jgi:ribosomal-protein-alanine N-acetyltransferase
MTIPTITTARLILRPFAEEDTDPLHQILGDRDVIRYLPTTEPPARDRVRRFVIDQIDHWQKRGYGWWAVEPRAQKTLIGWNGLRYLPETDEIEVAYLLSKAWWGQGLATEGAKASLRYGFETIGMETIIALVHPENAASQRVIEKLGMTFIEQALYFGIDCRRYTIARSAWETAITDQ